jgi:D-alanine-D-alanine ligase
MKPTRVLILAGGRSEEHEVSITSAGGVLKAVRENPNLDASALVVTREGRWLSAADSQKALTVGSARHGGELVLHGASMAEQCDVVFPLIHGPFGEDGTLQGMLELAGIPYVGSGVLASALCMDKPMCKEVLRANNIPQVTYVAFTGRTFKEDPKRVLNDIKAMKAPWFVKPANLGSSVGISKVKTEDKLTAAIEEAMQYDRRIIVEEGVPEVRELEVGILGNEKPKASPIGEITYDADFYDYKTKYTDGKAQLRIPADVPADVAKRMQTIAVQAYQILDCAGFARIDFFYQAKTGALYLNELNTIPGFTPFSMFPKLWEAGGIKYAQLIEELVRLAQERAQSMRR